MTNEYEKALETLELAIHLSKVNGTQVILPRKTAVALRNQAKVESIALALELILKTHDLTCKGEECQVSGIDLGRMALAAYRGKE